MPGSQPKVRRPNMELFPNRHRNKLCAILDSDQAAKLSREGWKKGTTCHIEMYATGPVGVVVYLCTHQYGWSGGGPTTKCSYVRARITASRQLRKPRGATTTSRYFRTEFVLIEDGPNHVTHD